MSVQVRASFWFLLCSFVQNAISVLTTPIYTRIMSTTEYGQFGVFNSWLGIISIIVTLSLTGGVHTQGLVKYDNERNMFTSALLGLTTVMVIAWSIIYCAFSDLWNNFFSMSFLQGLLMFVILWTSAVFGFWANGQRVTYSYRVLVIITIVAAIFNPLISICLISRMRDKVTGRILGWAISNVALFGWMAIAQFKTGKMFYSKKYWKYAIGFNLPLVPHYLSQIVLNSADRIMIKEMVGDSEAGVYNLAYSISLIMTLFNTALSQTLNPWMYQKIKDKKSMELAPVAYITLIMIAVLNLLLIMIAPEVVMIFAPDEYKEAMYVIPPIAMSVFFMYSYDLFAKFAFYFEKTKSIMIASLTGAMLNIILNYIFINKYGYMAAGYTTLVCYFVYAVVHYYLMKRVCRRQCNEASPYEDRIIVGITIIFLIVGFALMLTYQHMFIRYGIIAFSLFVMIVKRKEIVEYLKMLVSLKNIRRE